MKPLTEILEQINNQVDRYDTCQLGNVQDQAEIGRSISTALYWLEVYRVEAYNRWLDVYNETTGTNAAKEKAADSQVRELYQIRHIDRAASRVLEMLRSSIGVNKR